MKITSLPVTKSSTATLIGALLLGSASPPALATTADSATLASKFWNAEQSTATEVGADQVPLLTAIAGDATHDIQHLEAMRVLPESRAEAQHRGFASEREAEPGHVWYVVRGRSANTSFDQREFRGNDIDIMDGTGKEYTPSWSPAIFQPESMQLQTTALDPGGYKHWLAFFEIPEDAVGLSLRANNLSSIEKQFTTVAIDGSHTTAQESLGSIHHNITEMHQLVEIPAEWTIEKYADRAAAAPAKEGQKWIVVRGETINSGRDARRLSSREYILLDAGGNEYRSTSPGYRYKTPETGIQHGWLESGASVTWKLFFDVPNDIGNPRLRLGNLASVRKESTAVPLTDPAILLQSAPAALPEAETVSETADAPEGLIDLGNHQVITGEVEHKLISAEVLPTISASRLTEYWREIGMTEQLPAPENTVWIHINGNSTNHAQEERSLNPSFTLIDSQDREYSVNVGDTQLYVPDERSLLSNFVQPGETQEWEAWFLIHQDAEDIRIKLDDLTFLAEFTLEVPLFIDNALIMNRGVAQ